MFKQWYLVSVWMKSVLHTTKNTYPNKISVFKCAEHELITNMSALFSLNWQWTMFYQRQFKLSVIFWHEIWMLSTLFQSMRDHCLNQFQQTASNLILLLIEKKRCGVEVFYSRWIENFLSCIRPRHAPVVGK